MHQQLNWRRRFLRIIMITGVMIMTIMKITDDDWITKIVTMIIISTIILIMILKKIQKFKINFCVELNATRT